ncbi:MAG: hypothetical protein SVM86_04655 [Candidatus Cloacimonadota bacterium]|nr:hypothetical protein [Candidatus Cloacimonadota bacterium]
MKKITFFALILFFVSLFSQQEESGTNMGGGVGTVMMGNQTYTRLQLTPEFRMGKFAAGLNFDLLIDSDGNIREEDWDEWQDYLNKIYYVRYGLRGDTFFAKVGGFEDYSLGKGLVMKNYSNMLRYPQVRQIGLQVGGKLPFSDLRLEFFSSNLAENDILAGRAQFKPFREMPIPLLNNIILGGTIAHDRNQINGLIDTDEDGYADYFDDYPNNDNWHNEVDRKRDYYLSLYEEINDDSTGFTNWFENSSILPRNPSMKDLGEDDVTVWGIDYELPLYQSDLFYLSNYGEMAQIIDHNMGFIFPGFYAKFLIFQMNLEYRTYQDDFEPNFFDYLYDEQRASVQDSTVYAKEETLANRVKTHGWFGSLTSNILDLVKLTVSYEDMYKEDEGSYRGIWGTLSLNTRYIPKLRTAEVSYGQTGFDKLKYFKTPNAYIKGKLGYSLAANTELVGSYQERYIDKDGSGKIEGKNETLKTMNFGVQFRF